MVEASDHGYVLHTRRIHVTRYRIRYDMISDLKNKKQQLRLRFINCLRCVYMVLQQSADVCIWFCSKVQMCVYGSAAKCR
jgi:hypothetical protein